jgi:hypothetical protein
MLGIKNFIGIVLEARALEVENVSKVRRGLGLKLLIRCDHGSVLRHVLSLLLGNGSSVELWSLIVLFLRFHLLKNALDYIHRLFLGFIFTL